MAMTAVYPDDPKLDQETLGPPKHHANGMTTKAVNKFVGSDQDGHQLETSGELFDRRQQPNWHREWHVHRRLKNILHQAG